MPSSRATRGPTGIIVKAIVFTMMLRLGVARHHELPQGWHVAASEGAVEWSVRQGKEWLPDLYEQAIAPMQRIYLLPRGEN
jgi:hypothetical protein